MNKKCKTCESRYECDEEIKALCIDADYGYYEYSCSNCKHYNKGKGEVCCDFCDPPFEDYWEEVIEDETE